jgi:putative membrane protein
MDMPYSKINPDDMILRDHLAYDRTVLANERTLLAYFRTAIALLASGGMLLKLFTDTPSIIGLGFLLLVFGILSLAIGVWRFVSIKRHLAKVYHKPEDK